jgi:Fe-S cluster assembly protein SufD
MKQSTALISKLPNAPEETWRRTEPDLFFMPEGEMLRCDGSPVLQQSGELSVTKISWTIDSKTNLSVDDFLNENDFKIEDEEGELNLAQRGFCVLKIDGAKAILNVSPNLAGLVTLSESSHNTGALFAESAISQALNQRLNLAVPSSLRLSISTPKSLEFMPVVLMKINAEPAMSQTFSNIEIAVADHCAAEVIVKEVGGKFVHQRHTFKLGQFSKLISLWQNSGNVGTELLEREVHLSQSAEFNDMTVMVSSGDSKVMSRLVSNGRKALAQCGALVICEKGSLDYEPVQQHVAPEGSTHLRVKMLGAGGVKAVFQGLIKVDEAAPHTVSSQINKNLLLSKRTKIDSLPKLEIIPNEVSCKHGSASGEVDNKQVYYLMTRGFSENEARTMVIKSFASEGLYALPDNSFCKSVAVSLVHKAVIALKVLAK